MFEMSAICLSSLLTAYVSQYFDHLCVLGHCRLYYKPNKEQQNGHNSRTQT